MWQHVGKFNVVPCKNPLHKYHQIPAITNFSPDPDYLYRSAKYVSRSYNLLSEKMDIEVDIRVPDEFFVDEHPFRGGGNETDD